MICYGILNLQINSEIYAFNTLSTAFRDECSCLVMSSDLQCKIVTNKHVLLPSNCVNYSGDMIYTCVESHF